jgi:O-Antigen ligase
VFEANDIRGSSPASARQVSWELLGGLIAGMVAMAAVVFAREAEPKVAVTLLGGLLMLVAMLMIRNLRLFSLYMIITLAPIGLRQSFLDYPHMGGAGAIFIEAVDPFLLLLLFFQVRDRLRGYGPPYKFPPAFTFWSLMIVLGVGSVLFMQTLRITAANEVVRMLKLLLLGALIANEVVTKRQFKHVVIALTLGVILESGIALAEYMRGSQLGLKYLGEASNEDIKTLSEASLLTREFVYRPSALLSHANLLAAYLALFLPMGVALVLTAFSRRIKLLLAIALVLGQTALVLTRSRAGWIDFLVAFVMVLTLGASNVVSRRRFLFFRGVIVVVTIAVAAALSPLIIQRLYETDPSAVQFRIRWLETAKAMIMDHPILGVGLNTYVFRQLPYGEDKTPHQMAERYGKYWPAVHNTWALTWAEQGTIGFLLYVAMHVSVIMVGVRNLRIRDPMMHALGVGLLAGFVAVMLDGLASFFVRVEGPARMFWIAIALILAVGYWRRANEECEAEPADPFPPSAPPSLGAGAVARGRWLPSRASALR